MDAIATFCVIYVSLRLEGFGRVEAGCPDIVSDAYVVKRFGEDCKFMCHCINNTSCDQITGSCPAGCGEGWYGPGCQYRNAAYNWCRHIDNIDPPEYCTLALDNDVHTCSKTAPADSGRTLPPWWRIWLPNEEYVTELTITTTNDTLDYFKEFEVLIENVTLTQRDELDFISERKVLCFKHGKDAPEANQFTVTCDTQALGNQIRIQLNDNTTQLVLCDVKINGGRNIAFLGNIRMSSVQSKPINSVDGIPYHYGWKSCSGTKWNNPAADQWWSISTGHGVNMKYLKLSFNNKDLMRNYKIFVRYDTESLSQIYDDSGNWSPTKEIAFSNINLIELTIQRENVNRLLICEVELFGECMTGSYGYNCEQNCSEHCKNDAVCNEFNGYCPQGCKEEYVGPTCKHIACSDGTYGPECSEKCSENCAVDVVCSYIDGSCFGNCKPGWTGLRCDTRCDSGTFGINCSANCSGNCRDEVSCDFVSGSCLGGCLPGYTGVMCNKKCSKGTFGFKCSSNCSDNCKLGTICHFVNGTCLDGCKRGYKGLLCDKNCENGTFGINCSATCSGNCRDEVSCDFVEGTCPDGCLPGYTGNMCNEECSAGTYGMECNNSCSRHCKNRTDCRNTDGICIGGCAPGYVGETCNTDCEDGFYGNECNLTCSPYCMGGLTNCSHTDGSCAFGCAEGWSGDTCHNECPNNTYGLNCNRTCGYCKNATCHPVHGQCQGRCMPGYYGSLCQDYKAVTSGPVNPRVSAHVTVIVVVVFLLVVVSAVLILKRNIIRKRFKQQFHSEITTTTTSAFVNELYNDDNALESSTPDGVDAKITDSAVGQEKIYANEDDKDVAGDAVYCNISPYELRVTDLRLILKTKPPSSYQSEFGDMRPGLQYSATAAVKEGNYFKNRYMDMYAYDHNRVKLKKLKGDPDSVYINASNIRGQLKERAYIAAQGPIKETLADFWRMIWEKDIHMIVMLTNIVEEGKSKCVKYWGDLGISQKYGKTNVTLETEEQCAEFTIRRLSVTQLPSKRSSRSVVQYHYTAWPDKGVPKTVFGLQHFWRKVRQNDENKVHTWLVHCSAGVGRTGTFIATDILYDQGCHTGHVNVHDSVLELRKQRPSMVQTKDQYVLLHSLLVEMFDPSLEYISVSKFVEYYSELSGADENSDRAKLFKEYQILSDTEDGVDGRDRKGEKEADKSNVQSGSEKFSTARLQVNLDKNRFPDVLASDEHRPVLSLNVEGRTDYINAVIIPSYADLQGYIISQLPLENTVIDFYRLVVDKNIGLIVTFPDEKTAATQASFLPEAGETVNGPFQVTFLSHTARDECIHRQYSLVYQDKRQTIDQLIYEDWPGDENTPSKESSMLNFMMHVRHLQDKAKGRSTLVQCLNGAERSGLFVTLMNIADYTKFDNEVSIPMIVRHMRGRRRQIISNFVKK